MNLKQGDLENIILNALWDLEAAEESKIFVSHVQDHIKNERGHLKAWAYTTVKTVLDRLVDKELVSRQKEGKKYFYKSQLDRHQAGVLALEKLLKQYFQNDVAKLEGTLAMIKNQPQKPYASRPTQMGSGGITATPAGQPASAPISQPAPSQTAVSAGYMASTAQGI
ncbi:MAG: BlaI/MecI/CopY family transcriptional regulator [Cyanobacteria bacterium HKST-UBA06]|nr:BlaI/MecI/CopY family transcriptional regulator [Cyanobacteria bacterium HKST-UBA06]